MARKHTAAIILIAVSILIGLGALISKSFHSMLTPKNEPNTQGLAGFVNDYDARVPKGTICDANGTPLFGNVALDADGSPMRNPDGSFVMYSDLDTKTQKDTKYRRMMLADGVHMTEDDQRLWSTVLPAWSSGADKAFEDLLKNISIENEQTADLNLTYDSRIQRAAYDALVEGNHRRASAVVMDQSSGDILAMTGTPGYQYNSLSGGLIPYTFIQSGENTSGYNIDEAHDCLQDYYKSWKNAVSKDNPDLPMSQWTVFSGPNFKAWRSKLQRDMLNVKQKDAEFSLADWRKSGYAVPEQPLDQMPVISFVEILQAEIQAGEAFNFLYEPAGLGNGLQFIPFVRVRFGEFAEADESDIYCFLRLCYGPNNFVLSDCQENDFDPHFSFVNTNLDTSPPGSSMKILTSALLAENAPESMIRGNDIMVSNVYQPRSSTGPTAILPTDETSDHDHNSLMDGLDESSNQYFSMLGMEIGKICQKDAAGQYLHQDSYEMRFNSILENTPEDCMRSGEMIRSFFENVFCINQQIQGSFDMKKSTIFEHFADAEIQPATVSDQDVSRGLYRVRPDGSAYFDTIGGYLKTLGDTTYGMGEDLMTPLFMGMAIGKCVTGKMVIPNLLRSETLSPETCGDDFVRPGTVDLMKARLTTTFNHYTKQNKLSDTLETKYGYSAAKANEQDGMLRFYAKTGTAAYEIAVKGTMGRYGQFADLNPDVYKVETDKSGKEKYKIIWFVGTVTDGEHSYSIVLRSYFMTSSAKLQVEFLKIVDALRECGYLK